MTSPQKLSNIILVGGGGHCRSVIDVLETAQIGIAGIVQGPGADKTSVLGYSVIGYDKDLLALREHFHSALVTVGQIVTSAIRHRIFARLQEMNYTMPVVISPLAHISHHAIIGAGTVVMHKALVNAGANIGANCIVNTGALIEHDCNIANDCHIAVGASICGEVNIGQGSFVGAGSVVRQGVTIGANAVIGMGSTVINDVPSNAKITGLWK